VPSHSCGRQRCLYFSGLIVPCLLLVLVPRLSAEVRQWTDKSGRNKIEAEFVSQADDKVKLRSPSGKMFEIAVGQLSEADQAWLKSQADNPFKEVGDSPFMELPGSAAENKSASGSASGKVVPDWSNAELLTVEAPEQGWSYQPQASQVPKYKAKNVALPKAEFGENARALTSNAIAKQVALSTEQGTHNQHHSRIFVGDLGTGRVIATQQYPQFWRALSIHSQGNRVLLRSSEFGFGQEGVLRIVRVQGHGLTDEAEMEPYSDESQAVNRDVRWAEFVGDNQLLTCSRNGRVALWDVATLQPVCQFLLGSNVIALGVNPNRTHVALADPKNLYLFDIAARSFAGIVPVPEGAMPTRLAFSPSGERIAVVGGRRVMTWNAATGEIVSDFPIPGVSELEVLFTGENYLLVGSQFLIDLENQVKLWQYQGSQQSAGAGSMVLLVDFDFLGPGAIMVGKMPHPEALDALEKAKSQGSLFLLKPGDTVELDVSEVPAPQQEQVREDLTEHLKKNRIQVGTQAPVKVKAAIRSEAGNQTYIIFGRGRMTVNLTRQISSVQVIGEGKVAWSQQADNVPGTVRTKSTEDFAAAVQKECANPNLKFFEKLRMPSLVQRMTGDGPNTWQALGHSTVSARGVR